MWFKPNWTRCTAFVAGTSPPSAVAYKQWSHGNGKEIGLGVGQGKTKDKHNEQQQSKIRLISSAVAFQRHRVTGGGLNYSWLAHRGE
jgi:hypothetical protein